jgi:hypothetical protein
MDWLTLFATVGATVAGVVLSHLLLPSLTEYGKAKGKNLADKEDIRKLTELVEDVKHENQLVLENLRSRQQLRMAAAEKRLQAHQEAFVMWRGLLQSVHSDQIGNVVSTCQQWWERNCLYLTADAREAFNLAYTCASAHSSYLDGSRDAETKRLVQANWADIMRAGPIIVEGVSLPSLGDTESKDVTNEEDSRESTAE